MKTKLLVTGSSGFLGSRLAHYYKEKYDLLLPSHSKLNISHEEAVKTYMKNTVRRQLFIVQRSATPGIANNIPKTHTK